MKLGTRLPAFVLLITAAGCGEAGQGDDAMSGTHDLEVLRALDGELGLGDRGAAVRAVHAYLARYGYFPNDALARAYPAWRPYAEAPRESSTYDENTMAAVSALQGNLGLEESGIVDEKTRALLLQARCGNPDIQAFDESNKWELDASSWSTDSLTWRVVNAAGGVTVSQVRTAAQQALSQWATTTEFQFTELTSGTADIMIRFQSTPPGGGSWGDMLAGTRVPADGGDVYFNSNIPWSAATPTPAGRWDMNSTMIHELGHALGILHSSFEKAVMYPVGEDGVQKRLLWEDDRIAAQAKNIRWEQFDNISVDIDVGDGPMFHHTYVTGGAVVPGGREVWALQNGSWVLYPGQGAVRISGKGSGNVWIVQDDGDIYQRVSGSWVKRPGCATDIAVADDVNNSVWIVGCSNASGGFNVFKWRGTSWGNPATGGIGAVRISLGRRLPYQPGQGGIFDHLAVPWIVQDDGDIYRRDTHNVDVGNWEKLPGGASDIAASPTGYAWSLGENPVAGGFRIYAWNEQDGLDEGVPPPSELRQWVRVPGTGRNIAADSAGSPYYVDSSERAFW